MKKQFLSKVKGYLSKHFLNRIFLAKLVILLACIFFSYLMVQLVDLLTNSKYS